MPLFVHFVGNFNFCFDTCSYIFVYYLYVYGGFACVYVMCHVHAVATEARRGIGPLELERWAVVSCNVGGIWNSVLWKSNPCS